MMKRMLEEIEKALKEVYLHIANNYDVSELHYDGDKVACTASAFRNMAAEKVGDIVRAYEDDGYGLFRFADH